MITLHFLILLVSLYLMIGHQVVKGHGWSIVGVEFAVLRWSFGTAFVFLL